MKYLKQDCRFIANCCTIITFIFFLFTLDLLSFQLNVTKSEHDKITFKFDITRGGDKILLVIRPSDSQRFNPDSKVVYKPDLNFSTKDSLAKTGKDNIVIYSDIVKDGEFVVKGLKSETDYLFEAYENYTNKQKSKPDYTFKAYTIGAKPKKQAKITSFSQISTESMKVSFSIGDGKRRMLVVNEEKPCSAPVDGIDYTASPIFGKGTKIGETTYIVLNDIDEKNNNVVVTGLKPGTKYYFAIYEANGNKEKSVYLTKSGEKPVFKSTLPEAPEIQQPENISKFSFLAKWKKVKGALTYECEVAKDESFYQVLPDFQSLDVGNIDKYFVEDLPAGDIYYFRVRAFGESGESAWSKVIKVTMQK